MERKVLVVCSVVGLLGILSAVTGFVAEATRIKVFSYEPIFNFLSFGLFYFGFSLAFDFNFVGFSWLLKLLRKMEGGKVWCRFLFFLFGFLVNFRRQCIFLEWLLFC